MNGVTKTDNIEAIINTWCHWLRQKGESNPRRATLTAWAEYNIDTSEEILDKVWETYLQKPRRLT